MTYLTGEALVVLLRIRAHPGSTILMEDAITERQRIMGEFIEEALRIKDPWELEVQVIWADPEGKMKGWRVRPGTGVLGEDGEMIPAEHELVKLNGVRFVLGEARMQEVELSISAGRPP